MIRERRSLEDIASVLLAVDRFLVCGHVMPDGDCLGSVLAMTMLLRQRGKKVVAASPDPVPELYSFLPGIGELVVGEAALSVEADAFVVLDCSVPQRLGVLRGLLERIPLVVNIDHHAGCSTFAHYNYIDPRAAATAEIIFDLVPYLGGKLTSEVATCLYVGIVTDTGSFLYDSTTAATHRRAAALLEAGVPVVNVNFYLYEERPLLYLRLLQEALTTLRFSACGRVGWMVVTRDLLERVGARDEHTDGLINYVRSVKGVEVALLFREIAPGRVKVSFRSKWRVDVNQLAACFGGGGHMRAAGAVMEGDIDEIVVLVVTRAVEAASKQVVNSFG